jgi:two-component system response regulator DctR
MAVMSRDRQFRVLLIEDDPMVQEVNRQFVERVDGFQVVGAAGTGAEGLQLVRSLQPDLIFLDVFMPSLNGLETMRRLRTETMPVDVVVVTEAKDAATVQTMLRAGAFDYILKPFKFERIRDTLMNYRSYREVLQENRTLSQHEVDALRRTGAPEAAGMPSGGSRLDALQMQEQLPKGLNGGTMKQIVLFMQREPRLLSAEEVADGVGIARVTARRYLDYLEKSGRVTLDIRYGGVGRPINRYGLRREQNDQ